MIGAATRQDKTLSESAEGNAKMLYQDFERVIQV